MERLKEILKKFKLAAILILLILFFAVLKNYEMRASRSVLVNILKRCVAEMGNFTAKHFIKIKETQKVISGPYIDPVADAIKIEDYIGQSNGRINQLVILKVNIKNYDILESTNNFQYENFMHPKLQLLRRKYKFDELVKNAHSELEKIIILRDWVSHYILLGEPKNVDYNFNALDILARAEKGERFFCSEYATVFAQCLLAMGYVSRYVGLLSGHVVTEVWSNGFTKWIIMDAEDNLHYEQANTPLGALELHNVWESKGLSNIKALQGIGREVVDDKEKERILSFYHEFYVRMRNDWFSNRYPHWHPKGNSIMNGLEWQDRYTTNNILIAKETSDAYDINFPINTVSIMVDKDKSFDKQLRLLLSTFTPGFSYFTIKVDDNLCRQQKDADFTWNLHDGVNKLEINSVNNLEVNGPISSVKLVLS